MGKELAWGFDIGGTSIRGGLVDERGEILEKRQVPTPKDPQRVVESVIEILSECTLWEQYPLGISCAGTVDVLAKRITGLGGNIENWKGFEIGKAFRERGLEIGAIDNDANCALKAELVAGNAQGLFPALMLTIGTGIGGAFSFDGKNLYHGANYAALEIGHIILSSQGRQCSCGQRGCAEEYLSARIFHQEMQKAGFSDTGAFLKSSKTSFIRDYWSLMGDYIVSLENIFNPALLLIGGGFVEYAPNFISQLRQVVEQRSNGASKTRIDPAKFQNDSGLIGAAFLARECRDE